MNTDAHLVMAGKSNSIIQEITKSIIANLVKNARSIIVLTSITKKIEDRNWIQISFFYQRIEEVVIVKLTHIYHTIKNYF